MATGVLTESLLRGPTVSTTTTTLGNTSGGARGRLKNKLKAFRNYRFNNFMDFE